MKVKKQIQNYHLTKNSKGFSLTYKNNIRLNFKIRKTNSNTITYEGHRSTDIYFSKSSCLKLIKSWYLIDVKNKQLIVNREIQGQFDHISVHDLKGDSSQQPLGKRRLYNFHYKNNNISEKIEILGNSNDFNDMGLFHIVRTGKTLGIENSPTIVESLSFIQNFNFDRLSASTLNQVINDATDLEKIWFASVIELFNNLEFRNYFYSFITIEEIPEFEKIFQNKSFFEKINQVLKDSHRSFQIADTRFSLMINFQKKYDPKSPYFEIKKKIEQSTKESKVWSFCILGHIESIFEDKQIIVGCF